MVEDGEHLPGTVGAEPRAHLGLDHRLHVLRPLGPDQFARHKFHEHVQPTPEVVPPALFPPVVHIHRAVSGSPHEGQILPRLAVGRRPVGRHIDLNGTLSPKRTHITTAEAEIQEVDETLVRTPREVGSLDVAMDDADRVHVLEGLESLLGQTEGRAPGEPVGRGVATEGAERTADEAHHHHVDKGVPVDRLTGEQKTAEMRGELQQTQLLHLVPQGSGSVFVHVLRLHGSLHPVLCHFINCAETATANTTNHRPSGHGSAFAEIRLFL